MTQNKQNTIKQDKKNKLISRQMMDKLLEINKKNGETAVNEFCESYSLKYCS